MKYLKNSRGSKPVISRLLMVSQLCFSLLPHILAAVAAPRLVTVQAVRITNEDATMVALIDLDGIAAYTHATLANPPRVIVDIIAVSFRMSRRL